MIEFINENMSALVGYVSIILTILPTLIAKILSDKKLLKTLNGFNIKTSDVENISKGIQDTFNTVNSKIFTIEKEITNITAKLNEDLEVFKESFKQFETDETFLELKAALTSIRELESKISLKNDVIEKLGETIKDIKKKLGD